MNKKVIPQQTTLLHIVSIPTKSRFESLSIFYPNDEDKKIEIEIANIFSLVIFI
jgi:hypothetical protein